MDSQHPYQDTSSATPADKARVLAGKLAHSAGQAVQSWTTRKYTLPDKNVASQVLMYRQLLHTKCRPGLKLSREYQATPAQKAVLNMPWWCEGIEETRKMVISYDNLITRLWLQGAIVAHNEVDTMMQSDPSGDSEKTVPPIPHEYWVSRLGFQQPDPVTDFRSGGVLSLAMLVWIVESCPKVHERFVRPTGDASVLPFGITSINITDMMAKFLMLSKSVDRMDALLSQKPFWRMFDDPNALLACQELSLDLLADVVVELRTLRRCHDNDESADVTVFDFSYILEQTERRVEHDLLGSGPVSVKELYATYARLKVKYKQQLENKVARMKANSSSRNVESSNDNSSTNNNASPTPKSFQENVLQQASGLSSAASNLAGSVFSKIKAGGGFNPLRSKSAVGDDDNDVGAIQFSSPEKKPPQAASVETNTTTTTTTTATTTATTEGKEMSEKNDKTAEEAADADIDSDWAGTEIEGATDQISNFSIGGEDDDDDDETSL